MSQYHQTVIVEAGEGINDAMPKVKGRANRWRLHGYWLAHGAMPQVIQCTPAQPLRCENRVSYKTTKNQTRPRLKVCDAELVYNSSELRGPTEVEGVPTFFMIEVHRCPDCAERRQADPGFGGQVSHRILTADMVKYSSHLSGVFEDILLEDIVPGRPVAFPFSEEHAAHEGLVQPPPSVFRRCQWGYRRRPPIKKCGSQRIIPVFSFLVQVPCRYTQAVNLKTARR